MNSVRGVILAVLFAAGMLAAAASRVDAAGDDQERAVKVKAAFVLNFVKYTHWPEDAFAAEDAAIVITVLGEGAVGLALESTVRGQVVGGRRIEVRRGVYPTLAPDSDAQAGEEHQRRLASLWTQVRQSHVLVVLDSRDRTIDESLSQGVNGAQLTVSDVPGFARRGGMLGLVQHEGRIVFEVNPDAVQSSRLKVSSKILALGRKVSAKEE